MSEPRARSRIVLESGTAYLAVEDIREIQSLMSAGHEWIEVESHVGQVAFPTEVLLIRPSQIASIQEVCEEAWVWTKRASEIGYARQLRDDAGDIAAAQSALAQFLREETERDG